jgi:hypothetical protein
MVRQAGISDLGLRHEALAGNLRQSFGKVLFQDGNKAHQFRARFGRLQGSLYSFDECLRRPADGIVPMPHLHRSVAQCGDAHDGVMRMAASRTR